MTGPTHILWTTALCALALSPGTASAQWVVETQTDAMTDEARRIARVENGAGFTLSVYRVGGEAVWATFRLPAEGLDVLAADHVPMYRVDKHEPVDLQVIFRLRDILPDMYVAEPQWVNFQLWHGKEDELPSEDLEKWMTGERIVFRYFLFTGGYKETSFSLVGAAAAISEATGVRIPP